MNTPCILFAATRYWQDPAQLQSAFEQMRCELAALSPDVTLVVDGDLSALPGHMDHAVILPLSGAVQRGILQAAERCSSLTLYASYCQGNFSPDITKNLLYFNAAPTLMDTWAVLRRTHANVRLAVTKQDLWDDLRAQAACQALRGEKLVLIGETEPWVISNASSQDVYQARLGVQIETVSPEELIDRYEHTSNAQAEEMLRLFAGHAQERIDSTVEDMRCAARFAVALNALLDDHSAHGGAIACFNLIARTGTNACLGVAYLNNCTDKLMACEGDLDSAVTMALARRLARGPLWIANPCLDGSGRINFSHCTAPWHIGGRACPYVLRRHHESGVGVSLQVDLPKDLPLTLVRISDQCRSMTVHTGCAADGPRLPVCHTQMWVELENPDHYLRTALGCHQVIAFEDIAHPLRLAAQILGLCVL